MENEKPVSQWIDGAKTGDQEALEKLWENYFSRLVRLARRKLEDKNYRFRIAGAEDVAISAFKSLWKGIERGRFPELDHRDNLWRILVVITARKVTDYVTHDLAKKRGAGKERGESALRRDGLGELAGLERIISEEPTPEFAAQLAESYENLLASLESDTLRQVAVWKMEGYTNVEIGGKLDVSVRTVARKLELIRKQLASDEGSIEERNRPG